MERFRKQWKPLVVACKLQKKRIATNRTLLDQWLCNGHQYMALRRAQFLPLRLSAIMHRIVSSSPGRDRLLFARVCGCFYRALIIVSGVAAAQIHTQRPHPLFAPVLDRPTDAICLQSGAADSNRFSVRGGRLETFFGSGRPTRIVFRFGPAVRPVSLLILSTRSARSCARCDRQMRLLCVGFGHVFPIRTSPAIASDHGRPTAIGCVAQGPRS